MTRLNQVQIDYLLKTKNRYRWLLDSDMIGVVTICDLFDTIEALQEEITELKDTVKEIEEANADWEQKHRELWQKFKSKLIKIG